MYRYLIIYLLLLGAATSAAQSDSTHQLQTIQVTAFREDNIRNSALHIEALSQSTMKRLGAFNIADALAKLPGIAQLSTGPAITKPIIRGLYGSRLLTLVSGMRFDNQQWQDEHGLGLSDVGISRVEIIKGPASLLYGSDAIAGVINVIEEEKAAPQTMAADYSLRFHSNTLGVMTDAGVKAGRNNLWWRVRAGAETQADYSDGKGQRILNSRFNGYYAKASLGIEQHNWTSENNYHFSKNDYGFILNDIYSFITPDKRWSRSMKNPHHTVMLHLLSSRNTKRFDKGLLQLNVGAQLNQRMEDEGGGQISLNMLLSTMQYQLQYAHRFSERIELIVNHFSCYTNNTNFGGRKIIPDAHVLESSAAMLLRIKWSTFIMELGAGVNNKWINTLPTVGVNTAGQLIAPFSINRPSANGSAGFTWNPTQQWNFKINAATGMRAPNLAELASNGVHEGIFTFEIGDPKLKNERNINLDLSLNYAHPWFQFSAATYYNKFFHYIYLQPTTESYYGFPVFRYLQQNASLTGAEISAVFSPQRQLKGLTWQAQFSSVVGVLASGHYLPYLPPFRLGTYLQYERAINHRVKSLGVLCGYDYAFQQQKTAPAETPTAGYYLLRASASLTLAIPHGEIDLQVLGTNLTNQQYFDHLSRYKAYGLHNMGRNVMVMLQWRGFWKLRAPLKTWRE
ncbi:MAG: TonB-dependent receptor [Chitinophagales bacterium]